MIMTDKEKELRRALNALRLAVDESIANDVEARVNSAIKEFKHALKVVCCDVGNNHQHTKFHWRDYFDGIKSKK